MMQQHEIKVAAQLTAMGLILSDLIARVSQLSENPVQSITTIRDAILANYEDMAFPEREAAFSDGLAGEFSDSIHQIYSDAIRMAESMARRSR